MSSRWTNIAIGVLALAVGALTVQNWRLSAEIAGLRDRTLPHDVKRLMGWKQRYASKLWHAGQAQDWEAAGWYAWQIRYLSEDVVEAGIANAAGPLADLETAMLLPRIEPVIQAARSKDAAAFDQAYRQLVTACNGCHAATKHAYIRISVPAGETSCWNQSFVPSTLSW